MAGVFDYKRYINIFATAQDIKETFPRDQYSLTWDADGLGADGWTCDIDWMTLLIDKVNYANNEPNFAGSSVIGYFTGSTTSTVQVGTTIILPANMYTGPIYPGGDKNVPATAVNLNWSKGTQSFQRQLLLIQNWEPGTEIGNPENDPNYIPFVESYPITVNFSIDPTTVFPNTEITVVATATSSQSFEISNTVSTVLVIPQFGDIPSPLLTATNFVNGEFTATFFVGDNWVEQAPTPTSIYTVLTSTITTSSYNIVADITRNHAINLRWQYDKSTGYRSGQTTATTLTVSTTRNVTYFGQPISINLTQQTANVRIGNTSTFTVSHTANETAPITGVVTLSGTVFYSTATAPQPITIGTGTFNANKQIVFNAILSTGTYTLTALYSGNIGDNIFRTMYIATASNAITHFVAFGREFALTEMLIERTANNDILYAHAIDDGKTANEIGGLVTFYQNGNALGTSTFIRHKFDYPVLRTETTTDVINTVKRFYLWNQARDPITAVINEYTYPWPSNPRTQTMTIPDPKLSTRFGNPISGNIIFDSNSVRFKNNIPSHPTMFYLWTRNGLATGATLPEVLVGLRPIDNSNAQPYLANSRQFFTIYGDARLRVDLVLTEKVTNISNIPAYPAQEFVFTRPPKYYDRRLQAWVEDPSITGFTGPAGRTFNNVTLFKFKVDVFWNNDQGRTDTYFNLDFPTSFTTQPENNLYGMMTPQASNNQVITNAFNIVYNVLTGQSTSLSYRRSGPELFSITTETETTDVPAIVRMDSRSHLATLQLPINTVSTTSVFTATFAGTLNQGIENYFNEDIAFTNVSSSTLNMTGGKQYIETLAQPNYPWQISTKPLQSSLLSTKVETDPGGLTWVGYYWNKPPTYTPQITNWLNIDSYPGSVIPIRDWVGTNVLAKHDASDGTYPNLIVYSLSTGNVFVDVLKPINRQYPTELATDYVKRIGWLNERTPNGRVSITLLDNNNTSTQINTVVSSTLTNIESTATFVNVTVANQIFQIDPQINLPAALRYNRYSYRSSNIANQIARLDLLALDSYTTATTATVVYPVRMDYIPSSTFLQPSTQYQYVLDPPNSPTTRDMKVSFLWNRGTSIKFKSNNPAYLQKPPVQRYLVHSAVYDLPYANNYSDSVRGIRWSSVNPQGYVASIVLGNNLGANTPTLTNYRIRVPARDNNQVLYWFHRWSVERWSADGSTLLGTYSPPEFARRTEFTEIYDNSLNPSMLEIKLYPLGTFDYRSGYVIYNSYGETGVVVNTPPTPTFGPYLYKIYVELHCGGLTGFARNPATGNEYYTTRTANTNGLVRKTAEWGFETNFGNAVPDVPGKTTTPLFQLQTLTPTGYQDIYTNNGVL